MTADIAGTVDTIDAVPVECVPPKPFDIRRLIEQVRECCAMPEDETQSL